MDKKTFLQRYGGMKFKITEPVLDIGGNDGSFLECNNVKKAVIIDLTEKQNPKYDYIKADISKKLPNLKQRFKTIFLTEVLEHLKNPLYLMAQAYDLLDEEGICYISIPYTKLNIMKNGAGNWDLGHVCRWKEKEILDQMRKIGFKTRVIQKRRRFKNTAFWLPHCWLVLGLRK